MKKLVLSAGFLVLAGVSFAAWNQECFYGKCCYEGILNQTCLQPEAANPVAEICHDRCLLIHGPEGGEFLGCKEECINNNGVIRQKTLVVAAPPPPQREAVQSSAARMAVGRTVRLEGDKYPFPSNSAVPSDALKKHIKEKSAELKGLKYNHVVITGYTDSTGKAEYNNYLSKERAEAVKAEFVKDGVPAEKIETAGKGPQDPIGDNKTAEGRKANRRVEIAVN